LDDGWKALDIPIKKHLFVLDINLDALTSPTYKDYFQQFMSNGYEKLSVVALMDFKDLDLLNIVLPGHRKGLMAAILDLNSQMRNSPLVKTS